MSSKRLIELYEGLRSVVIHRSTKVGRKQSRGIEIVCTGGVVALVRRCQELVAVLPCRKLDPVEPRPGNGGGVSLEITALLASMALQRLKTEVRA